MWLLPDPASALGVAPGRVYRSLANDERTLIGRGKIEGILTHRTKGDSGITDFHFPQITDGPSVTTGEMGQIQSTKGINIALTFFEGLLHLIAGTNLKAQLDKKKVETLVYKIDERYTKGVQPDDLENALSDFDIKKNIKMNNAGYRDYYVVTRVHYCKKLTLFSANLDSTDWQMLGNMEEIAEFAIHLHESDNQKHFLEIAEKITPFPFAVTYGLIGYSIYGNQPLQIIDVSPNQDLIGEGFLPPEPSIKTFHDSETPYAVIKERKATK